MRRAFTLVELLVVIAIMAAMVTVAVVSVGAGQSGARLKGAARDVFAAVRQARSIALVTQKQSIITFSSRRVGDEVVSSVKITSAELMTSKGAYEARTLGGDVIRIGEDASAGDSAAEGGHTMEEVLFQDIDAEVLKGVCIKVVVDGEEEQQAAAARGEVDEVKRSTVSMFSNVDFLLGRYKDEREKAKAAEAAAAEAAARDAGASAEPEAPKQEELEGERSLVWQVNGRCEPHRIYIYEEGADWRRDAWCIEVDRFGSAKILSEEGDGR